VGPARRVAAVASLLGLAACANVWGFANLTSEDRDASVSGEGSTNDSAGQGDSGSGGDDATLDADDGSADAGHSPCNLGNSSACRGKCPGNASPCGCLVDYGTRTTSCGVTGNSGQGSSCSSDLDCSPGYGCMMSTSVCTHWCRPASTTCPVGTCHTDPTLVFNGNEQFGFCY
jgi:hypothetical protein